jgi:hypothetical protein
VRTNKENDVPITNPHTLSIRTINTGSRELRQSDSQPLVSVVANSIPFRTATHSGQASQAQATLPGSVPTSNAAASQESPNKTTPMRSHKDDSKNGNHTTNLERDKLKWFFCFRQPVKEYGQEASIVKLRNLHGPFQLRTKTVHQHQTQRSSSKDPTRATVRLAP